MSVVAESASPSSGRRVVGLVPAAGRAARLGTLPCSKEIFPVGFAPSEDGVRPRPVCAHLLDGFRRAGIERALVLLRRGKWDIPDLLGEAVRGPLGGLKEAALELAYRVLEPTPSVPATLAAAAPWIGDCDVALGFPDILFQPADAFRHLLDRLARGGAEVVLGLFPTDQAEKTDMVEFDGPNSERVRRIVIKQPDRGLRYTWSIAVWTPRFTRFLVDAVAARAQGAADEGGPELYVGDVIQAAIDDRLRVVGVPFPEGSYLDVGTADDLVRAVAEGARAALAGRAAP